MMKKRRTNISVTAGTFEMESSLTNHSPRDSFYLQPDLILVVAAASNLFSGSHTRPAL